MSFYEDVDGDLLRQGDILFPVPFTAFELHQMNFVLEDGDLVVRDIAREGEALAAEIAESDPPQDARFIVGCNLAPGVVITQSCDLEREKDGLRVPVGVALIRSFQETHPDTDYGSNGFQQKMKEYANAGKKPRHFLLRPCAAGDMENEFGLADLVMVQTFSPTAENYATLKRLRRARLGPLTLSAFQERLSHCFGRVALPDDHYSTD